jgi:hypothetical protein
MCQDQVFSWFIYFVVLLQIKRFLYVKGKIRIHVIFQSPFFLFRDLGLKT